MIASNILGSGFYHELPPGQIGEGVFTQAGTVVQNATKAVEDLKAVAEVLEKGEQFIKGAAGTVNEVIKGGTEAVDQIKNSTVIVGLSDRTSIARLEKGVFGCVKGLMTIGYFGTIYAPAQLVCFVLGLGVAASGLVGKTESGVKNPNQLISNPFEGIQTSKISEGGSLAWAPTRWLMNLAKLSYDDIQEAVIGGGVSKESDKSQSGDRSLKATFGDLESAISAAFDIYGEETLSLQKKIAGVSKLFTVIPLSGAYAFKQTITGVIGGAVVVAAYFKGESIEHGANIALAPSLVIGALIKSSYNDLFGGVPRK